MSEIVLRLNPGTGIVEKIQLVASDERSQLEGLERLRLYLKDINQLSRHTAECARLYKRFKGESDNA
jgi:hypothetical protein